MQKYICIKQNCILMHVRMRKSLVAIILFVLFVYFIYSLCHLWMFQKHDAVHDLTRKIIPLNLSVYQNFFNKKIPFFMLNPSVLEDLRAREINDEHLLNLITATNKSHHSHTNQVKFNLNAFFLLIMKAFFCIR